MKLSISLSNVEKTKSNVLLFTKLTFNRSFVQSQIQDKINITIAFELIMFTLLTVLNYLCPSFFSMLCTHSRYAWDTQNDLQTHVIVIHVDHKLFLQFKTPMATKRVKIF